MWPAPDPRWLLAAALIYGWFWGSFLNQLVDRLAPHGGANSRGSAGPRGAPAPAGETAQAAPQATHAAPRPVTLLHPARSVCLACGRHIPWHDNLPIASYLLLRGRCRACHTPIGLRTLLMELATPLVCIALVLLWWRGGWCAAWLAWALGAASWLLLALPLTLERRGAQRPLAALAVLLAGWGLLLIFL